MPMDGICIFITGGTIDKIHDPISEQLVFPKTSHLPDMIRGFNVPDIPCHTLMLKDSIDMTDADRAMVVDAIKTSQYSQIIITHGTSTMEKTAAAIQTEVTGKTIVLTGAMRPFSLFQSDAGFNLGCAMAAAQTLDHGVYITMNGQVFKSGTVTKNAAKGIFERTQ